MDMAEGVFHHRVRSIQEYREKMDLHDGAITVRYGLVTPMGSRVQALAGGGSYDFSWKGNQRRQRDASHHSGGPARPVRSCTVGRSAARPLKFRTASGERHAGLSGNLPPRNRDRISPLISFAITP